MALTPYTDVDQVRAAIGVGKIELADETLNLPLYEYVMNEVLRGVGPTFKADLDATIGVTPPRNNAQQRLVDLGSLYATYAVALQLVTSAPLFALKEMRDDRTADVRVDDPFKDLRDNIAAMLAYVEAKLLEAYEELFPGAEVTGYVDVEPGVAAGLAEDPVTG